MREIKFRVWDKDNQKMWDRIDLNFCMKYGQIYIDNDYIKELGISKNVELMQYTGLKDKNGKEIYEGDIIEMQHCDECNGLKAVVKRYWDGWWYFTEVETKGRMGEMVSQYVANFDEKFGELSYCIVIGNKYEDGDLIECS